MANSWRDAAVVFHDDAAGELQAAHNWYEVRSSKAAAAFIRELDDAISLIAQSPERWRRVLDPWRRYVLQQFPFSIIYRETASGIQIVAVAHGRRRPGYWRERID